MLRVILIALAVLLALRLFARLTAPRSAATHLPRRDPSRPRHVLSNEQRAELEAERERALREGRQLDAIEIHRKLNGPG